MTRVLPDPAEAATTKKIAWASTATYADIVNIGLVDDGASEHNRTTIT